MKFDCVITVCDEAKEVCPFFPGDKKYLHKGFVDPSKFEGNERKIDIFRKVRGQINKWIEKIFCKT